jgi:hypothetical protein
VLITCCPPTGACEGSISCSTCHVIVDPENYDKLPEPSDDENDMLDLAFGLSDTYVRHGKLSRRWLIESQSLFTAHDLVARSI